jgi:D-proline reductase (dithiol) PrdB
MNPRQKLNRILANAFTRVPLIGRVWGKLARIDQESNVPWTPMRKPLRDSRVCLITTGGIHLRTDKQFDMEDSDGDPTYRVIPSDARAGDLSITHNYYDHRDADRDFNIILPLDRMRELLAAGHIGGISRRHYSFMGHIDGPHLATLKKSVLPQLVTELAEEKPDFILLTPA